MVNVATALVTVTWVSGAVTRYEKYPHELSAFFAALTRYVDSDSICEVKTVTVEIES